MAKQKGSPGVPNKHIYSRVSYLYQAATLLATFPGCQDKKTAKQDAPKDISSANQNTSRRLLEDMRSVSLKAQIRQSPALKHTICKFCNTLLVEGRTCRSTVENASKGGKKPGADMLVIKCDVCGGLKRYPVSAPKQLRKGLRGHTAKDKAASNDTGDAGIGDET